MNEIIISTLQNDLHTLKNLQNFLEYISDCFSDSSVDLKNFSRTQIRLASLIKDLDDTIFDIQTGYLSFEYKK